MPGSYYSVRYLGWGDVGATFWLVAYLALLALAVFLRFRAGSWRQHRAGRRRRSPPTEPLGRVDWLRGT